MQFEALAIAPSLAIGLTSVAATLPPVIRPRPLIPYTPGDLATHDARVSRRDLKEARGSIERWYSQARDGQASALAYPHIRSKPRGGTLQLGVEHHSPMLPRVLMPIQFGSQNVQLYTYIAGLNPDCIAFGTYDPSKSTSAIRYPDIFVNEFGVGPRKGRIYSETAYVAGVPVMNVTLGYVPASSSDPSMCGIAWPHPGASFIGDAYDPWLETAMDYGAMYPSWFSIQYRLGGVSTMSFGASIPEVPSPASWVTSDPDAPGFWSLPGSIGGISSYLIVDPSASTIFGSTKDITAIIKSLGLEHSAFRDEDNLLSATYPCTRPPQLVVIIGTAKVPISKEVMTFGKDAKGNCILPMRGSDDEKYLPSLGSPFLASLKSIVFDYEARAVSVIPL